MRSYLLLLFSFLFFSCDKGVDYDPVLVRPEGTYTGTFQRDNGPVSRVEITFSDNRYTGEVIDAPKGVLSPRICGGLFEISAQAITFNNQCFFTAEFDWSLVLSNEWRANTKGNQLTLVRNGDRYVLTK